MPMRGVSAAFRVDRMTTIATSRATCSAAWSANWAQTRRRRPAWWATGWARTTNRIARGMLPTRRGGGEHEHRAEDFDRARRGSAIDQLRAGRDRGTGAAPDA